MEFSVEEGIGVGGQFELNTDQSESVFIREGEVASGERSDGGRGEGKKVNVYWKNKDIQGSSAQKKQSLVLTSQNLDGIEESKCASDYTSEKIKPT